MRCSMAGESRTTDDSANRPTPFGLGAGPRQPGAPSRKKNCFRALFLDYRAICVRSESGAQPMASADGRYVVTFSGEIYSYRELRAELERDGCTFRSHSDTEVLLHLYAEHGERMVESLRGMYAFGIWDSVERTLF